MSLKDRLNSLTTSIATKFNELRSYVDSELQDVYSTIADTANAIPTQTSELTNDSGFLTDQTVTGAIEALPEAQKLDYNDGLKNQPNLNLSSQDFYEDGESVIRINRATQIAENEEGLVSSDQVFNYVNDNSGGTSDDAVLRVVEDNGSYTRPTTDPNVTVMFIGAADPETEALEFDIWIKI